MGLEPEGDRRGLCCQMHLESQPRAGGHRRESVRRHRAAGPPRGSREMVSGWVGSSRSVGAQCTGSGRPCWKNSRLTGDIVTLYTHRKNTRVLNVMMVNLIRCFSVTVLLLFRRGHCHQLLTHLNRTKASLFLRWQVKTSTVKKTTLWDYLKVFLHFYC